jgi:glycosyltransferase involved in cell wall biosynthesis
MNNAAFVVPGRLETRTGGSIYDLRMVQGLRGLGWTVDVRELGGGYPRPTAEAVAGAADAFAAIPSGTITLVDGLALGALPEVVRPHAARLRLVALVHLPLAAEVGLSPDEATRLRDTEQRALEAVRLVVVTGRAALPWLDTGWPSRRVIVVEPGTDRGGLARPSHGGLLRLLSVGAVSPGKGHRTLLLALAALRSRQWHLTCAGSLTRHPRTVTRLRSTIERLGLHDRVTLAGDLDRSRLEALYEASDVFVLATERETYGMAVAEAIGHGLPVVSTTVGAIPDLVGDRGGLLVPPGDTAALGDALSRVLGDRTLRSAMTAGARQMRERLPSWEAQADRMAAALESVAHD